MPTFRHIAIPLACATAVLLGGLAAAQAQAPAPATPAPVPEAMPFDIPYGTPIDLDTAHKAILAAAAEAKKHNWKMAIAVVGPAGQLVAHATMDGTQYASIDIAQAKARSAALFRRPSKAFADVINSGTPSALSLLSFEHVVASEGGFPIVVDGKLIGAIGASGGIATQDGVTATAGLNAVTPH
ncbi:MAG TPA: heme-binding protein [Acetobacteraceae bacterium]|jgi:glc operon protein GlcG|nr:heme-binding protein [Acetobacteraceae bacterium]